MVAALTQPGMPIGIFLCSALLLAMIPSAGAQVLEPWDAALHLHHPETAAKFDAKCLDGAPPWA